MKSISTKLIIYIGIATGILSIFILSHTYSLSNKRVREIVAQQASMALKFDLAIRKYVAENIRPLMYELVGENEFVPETMSTSYVARSIFEDVRSEFSDYIIKFSSDNPRNPANQAGPEELKIIEYLNNNPELKRWEGVIAIDGREYMAKFSARRMKESCLRCHGDPKDAPASLLKRYGSTAGFYRPIGKIIGLDTVAIPMTRITEKFWSESMNTFLLIALGLVLFFIAITLTFKFLITNRLFIITQHFETVASQTDYSQIEPVNIKGNDEINTLASSFNTLANKLKNFYLSLDKQVKERTRELVEKNEQLRQEIDERRRAEAALREREATLRSIFLAAPTGIGMVSNRNLKQVNARLCAMLGYSEDELLGQSSSMLYLSAEEYEWVGKEKYAQIKAQGTGTVETRWKRKDGGIIDVLLSSTPIDPKDLSVGVTFTALDITEQKRSENEKKYLEDRLGRSQKMEALGLLAGGVAHDLNNVLSGIVSYPDLILMDLSDDSPLRKPILTIQDSGKKAAAIVQDLLTLARRGVTNTEVLNLNDVISEYLESPEHQKLKDYNKNVHIEPAFEAKLLNIKGSSVHLKKTVMNLISNAVEALPPNGGKISIATENRYVDKPIKGYEEVKEGDFVVIKIQDDGVGIEAKDLKRIFEPFYTKKIMGRSGTGLGMSVVWGTVQDHRGYINVESIIGKGTTFELFFPVTREDMNTAKGIVPVQDYLGNGESVLIVDDVKGQREIASDMLTKLGYAVSSVSSGEEAIENLMNNSADILVLDMIMDPGIDGLETYRKVVESHPGQKAIIASGYSETDRVKEAQALGAGQYIKKPYTLEKIGLAVKNGLAQ